MPYIANTPEDQKEMMAAVGVGSFAELWRAAGIDFPALDLNFPEGMSEYVVSEELKYLAGTNAGLLNFIGGGFYDHFIPAAVSEITGRSEFYTAYTPYQPEASQGTLQSIYEYQSMICRLTGMEVSNASLYDGGSALFEAMMLACRSVKRRKAVVCGSVSPIYRSMLKSYSADLGIELVEVAAKEDGSSDMERLLAATDGQTACVLIQNPNFFGRVEDWTTFNAAIHEKGVLAILSCYPMSLALVKTPAEMDFDIVTGEGQCFGMALSFGGPYLGFMALKRDFMRKMPGRVVGRANDAANRDGFVLTMQAREQHIRREGAMSNICSNENLCALSALVYLSCVGKEGFVHVAETCASNAAYLRDKLLKIKGVKAVGGESFFNEFVVELPAGAGDVAAKMLEKSCAAGIPLGTFYPGRERQLLVAVTEKHLSEDLDWYAAAMEEALWN